MFTFNKNSHFSSVSRYTHQRDRIRSAKMNQNSTDIKKESGIWVVHLHLIITNLTLFPLAWVCIYTFATAKSIRAEVSNYVCVSEWRKGFHRQLIVGHHRSNDASQVRCVITAHNWHIWCVCVDVTLYSCQIQTFILEGRGKKRVKNPHESTKSFIVGICVHIQRTQDCIFLKKSFIF